MGTLKTLRTSNILPKIVGLCLSGRIGRPVQKSHRKNFELDPTSGTTPKLGMKYLKIHPSGTIRESAAFIEGKNSFCPE